MTREAQRREVVELAPSRRYAGAAQRSEQR